MAYNEWDDSTTPLPNTDDMRYELLKKLTRPAKAAIENMPGSAFVQGLMPIVNFPGQILGATAYGVGKQIADPENANFNKDTTEAMRATYYTPPSKAGKEYQESVASALEASKLPPYIGHMPPMRFNANDARVLAKQNIERAREFKNIPEDFANAQSGFQRESNLGGRTYGAQLQGAANEVGDVMARRQARGESAIPGVQVFSDLVPETNLYAVKPVGGQLVKAVDPVTGQLREVPNSSVAGISNVYEDIRKQTEGQGLINQYLRTFVNRPGIQDIWNDFNAKKVAEEFPGAPTPDQAREAFTVKYPTAKSRNERMTTFFDEFAASPEAQAAAADLGIKIPTFEEYQARITAANQWAQKAFPNYIQKFVGTKEDPALQLATQGITFKDPAQVTESATDALNYASPQGLREDRTKAGFNPEGEIQQFLKEKLTELKAIDAQLREMVTQRNSLYEQARTQNIDPAQIPEYAELTNKLTSKIAEKERVTQQAENYKLGKSYETLADLAIEPRSVKDLNRKLTFAEKQLFPYLDKTPEDATLYDINPTTIGRLGLTDMATQFMDDIVAGKIPVEQIGNVSIPKYIQETAMARAAKEAQAKKDKAAQKKIFDTYLQEQVQQIPSDKIFGNAAALELTNAMSKDDLMRAMSTDTEVLDHCVGQGGQGTGNRQYLPMVDPVTGEVPKGSSGSPTSYVRRVLDDGDVITSLRDVITGKPVGTIELRRTGNDIYNVGYASGYHNGRIDPQYTESLKNYLNSKASVINGSGDNLAKNGLVDQEAMRRSDVRDITGLTDNVLDQLSYDGLPRFLSREDIIELNNQRKAMLPSAQLNSEVATLNNTYADLLDENQQMNFSLQNADDDLAREDLMSRRSEIQSQLTDVNGRLNNLPIEDVTNFARELINDIFPENKKTPRARLQYLDDHSPISLRVQPRVYDTMREILRDERDAVGAPLTSTQEYSVNQEYRRVSREVARSMNGNMYNGAAVANNIRHNPDSYGLGEYNDQVIDGIARRVEEHGIIDPRRAALPLIASLESQLPQQVVNRLNTVFGNAILGQTRDPNFEQALTSLRTVQQEYLNPPPQFAQDLTENQRRMAVGEIQGRIRDLEQRAQRQPLVNSARPQEQRQNLATVVDNLANVIDEDHGVDVGNYVRDSLATINYDVNEDAPLYIERVRRFADESTDDLPVREAFNMIADRLVQGERANIAAAQAERAQLPAIQEPREVQDLTGVLDQEMNRIRDNYDEEVYRVVDGVLTLINDNYPLDTEPRTFIARVRSNANAAREANDMTMYDVYSHTADLLDRTFQENQAIQHTPPDIFANERQNQIANNADLERLRGNTVQNLINQYPERNQIQTLINDLERGAWDELPILVRQDMDEYSADSFVSQLIGDLIEYRDGLRAPQLPEGRVRDPHARYASTMEAYTGILEDNDQFRTFESLDALRALPQLIRREGATRNALGIAALSNEEVNQLARIFDALYDARYQEHVRRGDNPPQLPPPEGHKRGGHIQKMNEGGQPESISELDRALNQPGLKHKFTTQDLLKNYGDSMFESYDRAKARKRIEPMALQYATSSDNFDDGISLMHRSNVPLGKADTTAPSSSRAMEDLERQHMERLRIEDAMRRGAPGVANGGSIQSSKNRLLSPNIDEMRLALMKGK